MSWRAVRIAGLSLMIVATLAAMAWYFRPVRDDGGNAVLTDAPPVDDYSRQHYASLGSITRENVTGLQLVCSYTIGPAPSMQSMPVVADGVLYATTAEVTVAIDAATCAERWRYHRPTRQTMQWLNNRGVAVARGLVVRGTTDGLLLALDANTGALRWSRRVADLFAGETFTMAPTIVDSLILIGPAGSENAISGWVGAFRLRDGAPVWRFDTVMRDSSWRVPAGVLVGGGAVWTPFTYDTLTSTVYAATTNPAPDFVGDVRQGGNHYTNSVVALNGRTGALRWFTQLTPHDVHDWDLTHAGPVVDSMLVATGKDGILRALDRSTGRLLWATPVSRQTNVNAPITRKGTYVCPGVYGGVLWSGPAYSPRARPVYVNAVDFCGTYRLDARLHHMRTVSYMGGEFDADFTTYGGSLTAVDVASGSVRWRYQSRRGLVAGVLATASDLVFTGDLDGNLLAFGALDGTQLLRLPVGSGIGGGLTTYAISGRQYIAASTGRASTQLPMSDQSPARVAVFAVPAPDLH